MKLFLSAFRRRIRIHRHVFILAVCFSVLFLPLDTKADWDLYKVIPGREMHYYDPGSIVIKRDNNRAGRFYRRSMKVDHYIKISEKTVFTNAANKINEAKSVIEFYCPRRKYRLLKTDKLYKNGTRSIVMKMGNWREFGTNIHLEALYGKLCGAMGNN